MLEGFAAQVSSNLNARPFVPHQGDLIVGIEAKSSIIEFIQILKEPF